MAKQQALTVISEQIAAKWEELMVLGQEKQGVEESGGSVTPEFLQTMDRLHEEIRELNMVKRQLEGEKKGAA